jgi:hypothetical protein
LIIPKIIFFSNNLQDNGVYRFTKYVSFSLIVLSSEGNYKSNFFEEIGIGLAGFGFFFVTLGIVFLFDKGLLAIGNVSCLDFV